MLFNIYKNKNGFKKSFVPGVVAHTYSLHWTQDQPGQHSKF